MPMISTEIEYRMSGGAGNASAAASLGGVKSSTAFPSALFDTVTSGEASAGDIEYRCFYVHNANATLTLEAAKLWIQANTPSADTTLEVGLGTSAVNAVEQTVANEGVAPSGVTFVAAPDEAGAILLGDIPAGQHRAVWLKRIVNTGAVASNDTANLRVKGDTAA